MFITTTTTTVYSNLYILHPEKVYPLGNNLHGYLHDDTYHIPHISKHGGTTSRMIGGT